MYMYAFCVVGVVMAVRSDTPPTLPTDYFITGVLKLPYAEIKEPFTVFFNGKKNRSRIDYYDSLYFIDVI